MKPITPLLFTKLKLIVVIAIIVHLLLSLTISIFPTALKGTTLYKLYSVYLIPGPFFSENTINKTFSLQIRTYENEQWSQWRDPALENFRNYTQTFNVTSLMRSRFQRALLKDFLRSESNNGEQANSLKRYLTEKIITSDADTIQMLITKSSIHLPDSIVFETTFTAKQ